jgi:hypothetical protein
MCSIRRVRGLIVTFFREEGSIALIGYQLQQVLGNWLSPPNPSLNYDIACNHHHEGTGRWFTDGIAFKDWKASGSLLWIYGKRAFSWHLLLYFC